MQTSFKNLFRKWFDMGDFQSMLKLILFLNGPCLFVEGALCV